MDDCCEIRDVTREQRRVLQNDVVANVAVLLAALAVGLSGSSWPDIVMGLVIAGVFGRSALQIVRQASRAVA